jgi:hypothetical protein
VICLRVAIVILGLGTTGLIAGYVTRSIRPLDETDAFRDRDLPGFRDRDLNEA